jgi:hypothetical protein
MTTASSPMTTTSLLGMTAMTPCMPVQRTLRGGSLIKLVFTAGAGPIDLLHLYKNGTAPTSGLIDLGGRNALAYVTDIFWNHIGSPHQNLKVCIEYDPGTGVIIEVYEC